MRIKAAQAPEAAMLDRSLIYFLTSIAEDGIGSANAIFEARFGWSVRELRVLRLVRETPNMTFTRLAASTKFERSLTSRTVSALIKAGLITRTNSPHDARVFTLRVTNAGEALCCQADPLTRELEALMLEPLSDAERKVLMDMLERVKTWVQTGYPAEVNNRHPDAVSGK
ncbi:MAG: MarR family winged helix-turn-helix transcriptional regulator [Novosphingobium sp.]|jgi:DNA-binding MarR family transcriptional regulator|uniref:MarR family winged helix-turn-helix transcriptional regulator n=1 Tax=Novosphingobium sp. TaxID=1874826 RepID=UPI003B9CEF43